MRIRRRNQRRSRSSSPPRKTHPSVRAASLTMAAGPDETVRNAVAFLTQEDAESALIYALVHDPEFRLASALATMPSGADVNVIRALLFVFENHEDQLRKLLALLMFHEMVHTLNWNELFRANSATTALLREYTCELGGEFLTHALSDVINELWVNPEGYEVNPRYLQPQDDLHANQQRLEALAERTLDRIFSAASLFPYQIAKIYRVLELEMLRLIERDRRSNVSLPRLSAMGGSSNSLIVSDAGNNNNSSFLESTSLESAGLGGLPRLSSIEENLFEEVLTQSSTSNGTTSTVSAAKEEFYMHLGGLVFLRFLCPALVVPHKMNLTPNSTAPSKQMQRTLVLLAKLMQSLANNVEYTTSTESFMVPFNSFLARNRPKLTRFYDQLCQQAQNDPRRESLVARSNAAPRLSQLWSSRSSSSLGKDPSIVNLTGARFMEAPEAACAVLRNWMSSNLDYLAMEVADNSKFRRQQQIVVNNGSCSSSSSGISTPPTSATSAITASPVKPRPKRKLKTSKSAGYPIEIQEEDDEEKSSDGAKGSKRHDIAMPVSLEELDKIMGHTSHRDSQLMKVYYAKLSQNGLQRLIHVNDVDGAEWTAYRTNGEVEVFRKTPGHYVCPSGGFASEKDRLVEMKAHVIIRADPMHVFRYLRSLENACTTAPRSSTDDDDKTTIRRVEPLDDTKAVLYREHSKLSLWPAWLVKPRDSCDLHSFVEKTGRPDTYAVLQESIPRADVPERKGVVRMAYATGGYLIEPSLGDEEGLVQDATYTRLTCVVRADFKGLMPRYLAESIVYRQVLEIETIRSRVENTRHESNGEWV
ncbi:Neurofibromin-A [Phytophthora citrophthora]|uniref:Neurofibromin-A n=1 Tax=Phytophthora citrophthora TaxID=4793 RepID=A0AAD9G5U0_9STRA|nr:Neurofibromin-A [Phytophthora citrophthora]